MSNITIGKQATYTGRAHPGLTNRPVQVVAIHQNYFVDPDRAVIYYDPDEFAAKSGAINPELDMLEVRPVAPDGRLYLVSSDVHLADLRSLEPEATCPACDSPDIGSGLMTVVEESHA